MLRPIAKYLVPEVRRAWNGHAKAAKIIGPILKQRIAGERQEGYEKPTDALQWVRDTLPDGKKDNIYYAAVQSLLTGAASIHTTSQMITNVLFDLIAHPEYIELLREEISRALQDSDGKWNQDVFHSLKKMDSFVKESQGHNAIVSKSNSWHLLSPSCTELLFV